MDGEAIIIFTSRPSTFSGLLILSMAFLRSVSERLEVNKMYLPTVPRSISPAVDLSTRFPIADS